MRKVLAALLTAAVFLFPLNATAAVKSGSVCSKLGATSTSAGKKYTCIKSGKKLVWNKGVAVAAPKPSETPTPIATRTPTPEPTTSPAPTASATPTPSPTPSAGPIVVPKSLDDLYGNSAGIALAAWTSTNQKIVKSNAVAVRQDIYVGPNTTIPNPKTKDIFENSTRIFAGFNQPQSFFAIYYRFQDKDWAKAKLVELNQSNRVQEIDGSCGSLTRCNGASAGKASSTVGFSQFAVPEASNQTDTYHLGGGLEIHEYTHIAQAMQFIGKKNDDRNFWLNTTPNQEIKSFAPEDIEKFYASLMPGKYNAEMFGYVYTIGYITMECLVALKGIDSPMELILQVSNGATFEDAFAKVYGITWKDASPILAKTVSQIFLARK